MRTVTTRSTPAASASAQGDDAGKLVLRLAVGVLVLLHGVFKLQHGVGFISGMLEKAGVPGVVAYGVLVG